MSWGADMTAPMPPTCSCSGARLRSRLAPVQARREAKALREHLGRVVELDAQPVEQRAVRVERDPKEPPWLWRWS